MVTNAAGESVWYPARPQDASVYDPDTPGCNWGRPWQGTVIQPSGQRIPPWRSAELQPPAKMARVHRQFDGDLDPPQMPCPPVPETEPPPLQPQLSEAHQYDDRQHVVAHLA